MFVATTLSATTLLFVVIALIVEAFIVFEPEISPYILFVATTLSATTLLFVVIALIVEALIALEPEISPYIFIAFTFETNMSPLLSRATSWFDKFKTFPKTLIFASAKPLHGPPVI